jgi:hypothetical protein
MPSWRHRLSLFDYEVAHWFVQLVSARRDPPSDALVDALLKVQDEGVDRAEK